ncbi:hypothetical protein BH18ACT2_BH18ACT2_07200 [soil metagenome]
MTNQLSRPRRARLRRAGVAVAVITGMSAGLAPVVTAGSPAVPPPLVSVIGLRAGAYGDDVAALQGALAAAGSAESGGIRGYFGAATESAVRAFQRANGLSATGVVSDRTAEALGLGLRQAGPGDILGPGSTGEAVRQLQQRLIDLGWPIRGGADGVYGGETADAVRDFQRAQGYKVTGMTNPATMKALGLTGAVPTAAPAAPAASAPPIPSAVGLERGAGGGAVKVLQRALMEAGTDVPGGADGIFGSATEAALRAFQQSRGLAPTGVLDDPTARVLGLNGHRAPNSSAPAPPPAPAPAPAPAPSGGGLQLGSRGDAVRELQQKILSYGWSLRGGADGVFGPATQSRVILFQKSNGLPATGIVDDRTARAMGLTGAAAPTPAPTPAPAPSGGGPTADGYPVFDERGARVVALQQALTNAGIALRGGADGTFGGSTSGAIQTFQRSKGLSATGRVDSATAAALGLSPAPASSAGPAPGVALEARPVGTPCDYRDSWQSARSEGRVHIGTDIIAPEGTPLYAVATGRISKILTPETDARAGNGLRITKPDGTYFFYAHMAGFAPGIDVGAQVTAGQLVGYVGRTGNTGVAHLHLAVHPGGGSAINPYPLIQAVGAC